MTVQELYDSQLAEWEEFRKRVDDLERMELHEFKFGSFSVFAQYNPARECSTNAKLDAKSISQRKCFLCEENRPAIQKGILLNDAEGKPSGFSAFVNPFPILKGHLTIINERHQPQAILPHIQNFITFCKELPDFVVFYNGPACGASAPDHLHFQAVFKKQLPFEKDWKCATKRNLSETDGSTMEQWTNYGRNVIHIHGKNANAVESHFSQIYKQYQMFGNDDNTEPKMNLFGFFEDETYHLLVFPRKTHRPSQFYAEGEKQIMISPGAIDIAGIIVLPRKKDFDAMSKKIIEDVFAQVSL